MKKLNKSILALIICLVLSIMLSASASAADVGRVTGLKVSEPNNGVVTLSWNSIAEAEGYRVEYRYGNGTKYSAWSTLTETLQATTYKVGNLKMGYTYIFRVTAYDEVRIPFLGGISKDFSTPSLEVSVTNTIGKVSGLKVATTTPSKVKLTWNAVAGADGYLVQKQVNGSWKSVKTTTSTTYTVTGLKTGSTTPFRVRAYVKNGSEKIYGSVSSTVKGTAQVHKISDFKATSSGTTSVKLTWSSASVTGYQVYKKTESGSWKKYKTISSKSTTSFTDKGLELGTKYSYKIRGYYKTDSKTYYGDFSSAKSVRPTLKAVVGMELTSITNTTAVITWDKISGAQGYQVYDYASGSAVKLPTVSTNKAYIDISDGGVYKIKVRAYTKATKSGETAKGTFSEAFEILTPPTASVKNFEGEVLADGSFRFTWTPMSNVHGYTIYAFNTKAFEKVATTDTNTITITDVSSLPSFSFNIKAFTNNDGIVSEGPFRESALVLKAIATPEIFVDSSTDTSITLAWDAVAEADEYVLEKYDFDTDSWSALKITSETRYTDRGSDAMGGLYRVYARGVDSKSAVSEEIIASTNGIRVTQDGVTQTITWPAVEGASKYRVIAKQRGSDRGLENRYLAKDISSTTATVCLTPDAIESLSVYGYATNGDFAGCAVENLIIKTDSFKILASSDSRYNYSVNAQLLYLVEAINKTKHETNTVTVDSASVVAYDTDKIYINKIAIDGDDIETVLNTVNSLVPDLNKDKDDLKGINLGGTEKTSETLTFDNCIARNSQGKSINLARYVDPSDEEYAYLHESDNPTAWKNGIKSVTVVPTTNGGYKFVVTLYEESYGSETNVQHAFYHNGFATTVASLGQFATGDTENQLTTVGDTTITAVVNADGTLDSYQVSSPFSMKMKSPVTGLPAINSFGMKIIGTVTSAYKFTR